MILTENGSNENSKFAIRPDRNEEFLSEKPSTEIECIIGKKIAIIRDSCMQSKRRKEK
jgi:hypothetical protein